MKGANVLAIAVIAVVVLALVAKAQEPPVKPVPPPPRLPRPVPPPRPEPPPRPVLLPAPTPITPWLWHCEKWRGTGFHRMNPATGQIVLGLSRRQRDALARVGWVFPSSRQLREAEVRQRPRGVPRIDERYLPPDW